MSAYSEFLTTLNLGHLSGGRFEVAVALADLKKRMSDNACSRASSSTRRSCPTSWTES